MGIILLIIIIIISLVHRVLAKALNTCSQPLTTKQMISLRLEHQERNEENNKFKDCEPEAIICEYHRGRKNIITYGYHQRDDKNHENFGEVAGSDANALKFDHFSQLS